jgi:hypothetical protein
MHMRTTVTIEPYLDQKIQERMRKTGCSFKQAVNYFLLLGVKEAEKHKGERKPFKVKPLDLGMYPHLDYDDISELIEYAEGPWHR